MENLSTNLGAESDVSAEAKRAKIEGPRIYFVAFLTPFDPDVLTPDPDARIPMSGFSVTVPADIANQPDRKIIFKLQGWGQKMDLFHGETPEINWRQRYAINNSRKNRLVGPTRKAPVTEDHSGLRSMTREEMAASGYIRDTECKDD